MCKWGPWWGVNVKIHTHKDIHQVVIEIHTEPLHLLLWKTLTHIFYFLYTPQQCIRCWLSSILGSLAIYGLNFSLLNLLTDWLTDWLTDCSPAKTYIIAINTKIKDTALDILFSACCFWLTHCRLSRQLTLSVLSDHIWVGLTSEPEVMRTWKV